jgi:hypothetical protein
MLSCILIRTMACPEYIRLRQHYDAALRHWGQIFLLPEAAPGEPARLAAAVKLKALEERDAANDRMCFHKKTCTVCSRHSSR